MPIVQRYFEQVEPVTDLGMKESPLLTDYFERRVVVILGDPGIGKTTEFEQAKLNETCSVFCTVSQFLVDPIEEYIGKIIYLDALDEYRAELRPGVSVIDSIRGRLKQLGCPKARVSCRSQEWHHGADVKSLSDVAGGEPVYILEMQPLSENDIRSIASEEIEDVDAFLAGARERQLEELLGNPETLNLYLKVYQDSGAWPETRAALMDQSTRLLISEENEQHERVRGEAISDERLMYAAEDLSAILLFGDKGGIALSKAASSPRYAPLSEFSDIDHDAANVSARRRLFVSDGPERIRPQHKTIGDYLAATALVRRIRDKSLPLGRALSLLLGKGGIPLSHLRDVYAWLIALLPEHSERLIKADPFGAMIYGDVGQWPTGTRRSALKLLSDYAAKDDPWFRAGIWSAPFLGGLVDSELVEDFRHILETEANPHVISVVLSALEHGKPLSDMADDLLKFIRHPGHPDRHWLKDRALQAFLSVSQHPTEDCKILLEDVRLGAVKDQDHTLRGALLTELYPDHLGPGEVVNYFVDADISGSGTMGWFVKYQLVEETPSNSLSALAQAILTNPDDANKLSRFDREELNGALVRRLLEAHGDPAKAEQVYEWLGIYLEEHRMAHLSRGDSQVIRDYLHDHSELYAGLFRHWLGHAVPDKEHGYRLQHLDFQGRVLRAAPPFDFPERLLTWAANDTDSARAAFQFEEAVEITMNADPGDFSIDLDALYDFVRDHSEFADSWEQRRVTIVADWQWEQARTAQAYRAKKEDERAKNINILTTQLEQLWSGEDVVNLRYGAMIWFGLHRQSDKEIAPVERIRSQTNDEIAAAILAGFDALLKSGNPQLPSEIADLNCNNERPYATFGVLAGADNLAARSMEEFLSLPDANLKSAFAYNLIHGRDSEVRPWNREIMTSRPDLAREVLAKVWRTELVCGKTEYLTGSYIGDVLEFSAPLILCEIPALLGENPALPQKILEDLLKAILRYGTAEDLWPLAPKALAEKKVSGEGRTLWLAIAALLSPTEFEKQLEQRVRLSSGNLRAVFNILAAGGGALMNGLKSAPQLEMTLSILGKYFNNVHRHESAGFIDPEGDEEVALSLRGLIDRLAGLPTSEAADAFARLIADPSQHEWHEHLRHGQSIQAKNLRDAQFEPPSAQAVSALLSARAPASIEDLQALAVDILDECAAFIRGDNADPWKSFWILAKGGKLDSPKVENDCRNVMLPWIRQYLSPRGITVEPEAAAADLKRVDIRLTSTDVGTLPIEVKRDEHNDLWTAMPDQLLKLYANDPKAKGHAIYLVIWFGKDGNGCTAPPEPLGIEKPKTADELQIALEAIKPDPRFSVRVIDVSKPHG